MKFPVSFILEITITGHCYTMHTLRRHTSLVNNHHKLRNQRLAAFLHRPKVKTSGKEGKDYRVVSIGKNGGFSSRSNG